MSGAAVEGWTRRTKTKGETRAYHRGRAFSINGEERESSATDVRRKEDSTQHVRQSAPAHLASPAGSTRPTWSAQFPAVLSQPRPP
jgi:hypothetical protein